MYFTTFANHVPLRLHNPDCNLGYSKLYHHHYYYQVLFVMLGAHGFATSFELVCFCSIQSPSLSCVVLLDSWPLAFSSYFFSFLHHFFDPTHSAYSSKTLLLVQHNQSKWESILQRTQKSGKWRCWVVGFGNTV